MRKIIIFGASGDLARKRLYPALFDLFLKNIKFDEYIGYGRTKFTQSEFNDFLIKSLAQKDRTGQEDFLARFKYIAGTYDAEGLKNLKKEIGSSEKNIFIFQSLLLMS